MTLRILILEGDGPAFEGSVDKIRNSALCRIDKVRLNGGNVGIFGEDGHGTVNVILANVDKYLFDAFATISYFKTKCANLTWMIKMPRHAYHKLPPDIIIGTHQQLLTRGTIVTNMRTDIMYAIQMNTIELLEVGFNHIVEDKLLHRMSKRRGTRLQHLLSATPVIVRRIPTSRPGLRSGSDKSDTDLVSLP